MCLLITSADGVVIEVVIMRFKMGITLKGLKCFNFIYQHVILFSKCIKALNNKKDNWLLLFNGGLIGILCV
mgnify:FL=1